MLGDGEGDTGDVDLLEGVGADLRAGHVPGDGHQGHGVQKGGGDARDQVGSPGAAGGDDHPGPPRGAGVAVGGVGRALLVGGEDVAELVPVLVQGVVDVDDLPAGVAEDHLAALLDKCSDNDVSAG